MPIIILRNKYIISQYNYTKVKKDLRSPNKNILILCQIGIYFSLRHTHSRKNGVAIFIHFFREKTREKSPVPPQFITSKEYTHFEKIFSEKCRPTILQSYKAIFFQTRIYTITIYISNNYIYIIVVILCRILDVGL